ncbi:reverse transcriptase domain-containing protein [Tanacetum coccineum]
MTMILKDGTISKFPEYHSSEEEEEQEPFEQPRPLNKYGFFDHPKLQRNEFALHRLPEREGNMNEMAPNLQSGPNNNNVNPNIVAIIAKQLQNILPQIVTQVTNNVNNANGRNGGNDRNNGCTHKGFMACNPKEYDGKGGAIALTRWIEKMENWNTQVQARGREATIGMSWTDFKALLVEEFCPSNEIEKLESEFWNHKMVGANHVGYTDRFHELAKLVPHLVTPESSRIKRVMRKEREWNSQASKEVGEMMIRGQKNNGNQVKGRAFNVNAVGALQDPNVVTGTFSLNNHYATVLFNFGADFSFISTDFAPLLNVKPSFVNPGYVIEVADGKKVEVDRAEIVCQEKVVRIPLESGEILHVQGERTPGNAKALSNVKVDEPRLSDIPVVRDFVEVFPEDLSGLPPQ